ncbi:MAG: glycosyl transferase [Rhodospirillaceae bacterium]|nr:glycosyl transferase [Rhodospirillaceae bacterium]
MTRVSVIIPTFNRQDLISNCVDSVMNQTKQADEIIVVDDGSVDNTWQILREKGFSDSLQNKTALRYIYQKNQGVSAARNIGIKSSRYEYIALLDSDDHWLKNKLERQISTLEAKNFPCRISHTDEIWIRNGVRVNAQKKHAKNGGNIFYRSLKLCCISPSSTVIHKSVFEDFGYFDEKLRACEDYDFWLRFSAYEDVHFLNEPLVIKFGGHNDQLSKAYWGMDRFRIYALEKLAREKNLSEVKRQATLRELIFKLGILIGGAKKRDKITFAQELTSKKSHWEKALLAEQHHFDRIVCGNKN